MSALGETFRTMRESQGLTLSDVADRIHIRTVYLAAIEAEDWTSIGPPVYVRGFVRSYARCLRLDADAAVARLTEATSAGPVQRLAATPSVAARPAKAPRIEPVLAPRDRPPRPGLSLGAIVGVLIAFGLVLFVGYEYLQYSRGETVPVTVATAFPAEPVAHLPAGAAARDAAVVPRVKTADRPSEFAVQLHDSSWLRVVVDGKVAMEGLYPKGTQRAFNGRSATVRVGNAGGVDIFLDGKDLGPMGGLGDVAERSYQLEAR